MAFDKFLDLAFRHGGSSQIQLLQVWQAIENRKAAVSNCRVCKVQYLQLSEFTQLFHTNVGNFGRR